MRCCRRGICASRWHALRRADVVVVREEERERVEPRVRRADAPGCGGLDGAAEVDLPELRMGWAAQGLVAFCAIARPEDFCRDSSQRRRLRWCSRRSFPDHHRYTAGGYAAD